MCPRCGPVIPNCPPLWQVRYQASIVQSRFSQRLFWTAFRFRWFGARGTGQPQGLPLQVRGLNHLDRDATSAKLSSATPPKPPSPKPVIPPKPPSPKPVIPPKHPPAKPVIPPKPSPPILSFRQALHPPNLSSRQNRRPQYCHPERSEGSKIPTSKGATHRKGVLTGRFQILRSAQNDSVAGMTVWAKQCGGMTALSSRQNIRLPNLPPRQNRRPQTCHPAKNSIPQTCHPAKTVAPNTVILSGAKDLKSQPARALPIGKAS